MDVREKKLYASQWVILVAASIGAGATWDPSDWQPIELFFSLLVLSVAGEAVAMKVGQVRVSPSFLAIALGMALLGPLPAVVIGTVGMLGPSLRSRISGPLMLNNLATYATFPLVGGILIEAIAEPASESAATAAVALLVCGVFLATNFINFAMIVGYHCYREARSFAVDVRRLYLPVVPWELATAVVAAATVAVYQELGVAAVGLLAIMLFTYQLLLKAVIESERQRDELAEQMSELVTLHAGLLQVMMETLSLRDKATARHAAAVARFSRATAEAAGFGEREQERAHLAGLLHDIGKFAFTDSILSGGKLTQDDWAMIREHPSSGAGIVRKVRGFEDIAVVIESHHERIDGTGYPAGIGGDDIPALARIVAIADAYDVMTARDSYRSVRSRADAISELRSQAGRQFDARLVEVFVDVAERGLAFGHADDADFEVELSRSQRFFGGARKAGAVLAR